MGAEDMTVPLTPTNATNLIARAVVRAISERANLARSGRDGEWRNPDVRAAFLAVLDGATVRVDKPGTVRVTLPNTQHGWTWTYVGKEALESAQRRFGVTGQVSAQPGNTYALIFDPVIEL